MSEKNHFIFTPGLWIGQGKITFNMSPDHLHFYTRWTVYPIEKGLITLRQEVETEGREGILINNFSLTEFSEDKFSIDLTNELMSTMQGKGVISDKTIAWEFRNSPDFEGFEVYERLENGDYMLHAEFIATDNFRTIIDGRIWKKS